jgi:site-specific DNA recombinase
MNAVIYARFSSHNQTEQSIEGQLRVCYEFAAREGYKIVGEYIDRALTGRSDDRPDFQRMIHDAKKRAFQYVIVYKLDRFARNRYDSAVYKHKLKQCGVKVLSAMENIGDNPESIILEAVLEASAEYYSVDLSQKIKRGSRESAMKGQFVGGGVPFGYKNVDRHLVIDEEKAPIIKYVFEQYAAGVPKKDIIKEVNARGWRNKAGKPFGNTAFQTALKCEKYIGIMRWNDIETECPAIIDRETFDKVQERIALNKRTGSKNAAKIEYLLSGKAFCGLCGSAMNGVSGKGRHGGMFYYYSCRGRRHHNGCKKAHEKKDFIEWYVVEQTVEYVLTPERMKYIAEAVVAEYDKEFNDTRIKDLERRIAKLDRDIEKYVEMMLHTPKSAWQTINEKIELAGMQKTDLEIDLSKLNIANGIRYTKADIEAWLKQFCSGDLFDETFRRRIIDVFVNSVYLYDDRVIVFYNIRGGKQVSYMDMLDATEQLPDEELSDENKNTNTGKGVRTLNAMVEHNIKYTNPTFVFVNGLFGCIFTRNDE